MSIVDGCRDFVKVSPISSVGRFGEQLDLTVEEEIRSLEARRREPRTHSYWHRDALRRFQAKPWARWRNEIRAADAASGGRNLPSGPALQAV
jgi:hypothetical protein